MKDELYITVAKPCHQNWDKMLPAEQGRFCQSCSKQVIDFTQMSDNEILQLLAKPSAGTCGRFTQTQLEKPLIAPTFQPLKPSLKLFLTAFVAAFLLVNDATAQIPIIMGKPAVHIQAIVPKTVGDTTLSPIPTIQISGIVQDLSGQPIPGASVFIKGTKTGTATDDKGNFNLKTPMQGFNSLVVSSIGLLPKEITVQSDSAKFITVQFENQDIQTMGEVVVVGGFGASRRARKAKWLRFQTQKCDKPTANSAGNSKKSAQLVSFYPNPAKAGSDIKISFKKGGKYSLQLMDITGRIFATQLFDIADKNLSATMHMPDELNNGAYLLNLVTNGSDKTQTEKIIVQE